MTYHTDAWECNQCGDVVFDLSELKCGWLSEHYDNHYCPVCVEKMRKEDEKEKQYAKDVESGKIKIKAPKKPPIPKWCPKIKLFILRCIGCKRLHDCPMPDKVVKYDTVS